MRACGRAGVRACVLACKCMFWICPCICHINTYTQTSTNSRTHGCTQTRTHARTHYIHLLLTINALGLVNSTFEWAAWPRLWLRVVCAQYQWIRQLRHLSAEKRRWCTPLCEHARPLSIGYSKGDVKPTVTLHIRCGHASNYRCIPTVHVTTVYIDSNCHYWHYHRWHFELSSVMIVGLQTNIVIGDTSHTTP